VGRGQGRIQELISTCPLGFIRHNWWEANSRFLCENIAYLKKNIAFHLSTGQTEQALHKTLAGEGHFSSRKSRISPLENQYFSTFQIPKEPCWFPLWGLTLFLNRKILSPSPIFNGISIKRRFQCRWAALLCIYFYTWHRV